MRAFQLAIAKSGKSNLGLETQLCISKSWYFSYFSLLLVNDFLLPTQTVCAAHSAVSKVQSCSAWWVKWELTSVFCPCIPNSVLWYLSFYIYLKKSILKLLIIF